MREHHHPAHGALPVPNLPKFSHIPALRKSSTWISNCTCQITSRGRSSRSEGSRQGSSGPAAGTFAILDEGSHARTYDHPWESLSPLPDRRPAHHPCSRSRPSESEIGGCKVPYSFESIRPTAIPWPPTHPRTPEGES